MHKIWRIIFSIFCLHKIWRIFFQTFACIKCEGLCSLKIWRIFFSIFCLHAFSSNLFVSILHAQGSYYSFLNLPTLVSKYFFFQFDCTKLKRFLFESLLAQSPKYFISNLFAQFSQDFYLDFQVFKDFFFLYNIWRILLSFACKSFK